MGHSSVVLLSTRSREAAINLVFLLSDPNSRTLKCRFVDRNVVFAVCEQGKEGGKSWCTKSASFQQRCRCRRRISLKAKPRLTELVSDFAIKVCVVFPETLKLVEH